jgi:hypothetical protein
MTTMQIAAVIGLSAWLPISAAVLWMLYRMDCAAIARAGKRSKERDAELLRVASIIDGKNYRTLDEVFE